MRTVSDGQLTPVSYVVLGLVADGATTSYDMKQRAARSIGYFWSFPHSQLYAEPPRLVGLGLLTEKREDSGRRRRVYSLTRGGRSALDDWLRTPTGEQPQIRDIGLLKLFFGDRLGSTEVAELARAQEEMHRSRLAAYELKEGQIDNPRHAATLRAGLLLEKLMIDFWRDVGRGTTPP